MRDPERFNESLYRFGKFLEAYEKAAIPPFLFVREARILLTAFYGNRMRFILASICEMLSFYWRWYVVIPFLNFTEGTSSSTTGDEEICDISDFDERL